jgi:UDPglucose 6-dehydrogenase
MRIGVIGFGYVGKALTRYFAREHSVTIYDKYIPQYSSEAQKGAVNKCDVAFIAVPTVTSADQWSCDLSAIHEVFSWLAVPACIKSTVPPGTTQKLLSNSVAPIAFSPEYLGESEGHQWVDIDSCGFAIFGGDPAAVDLARRAYLDVNGTLRVEIASSAKAAELCKYMENAFLATKVAFVNQFFDIATAIDVDFDELKEFWLLDDRIGRTHCHVTPTRGFGGKCLPKDIKAIIAATRDLTSTRFLDAVVLYNDQVRSHVRRNVDGLSSPAPIETLTCTSDS